MQEARLAAEQETKRRKLQNERAHKIHGAAVQVRDGRAQQGSWREREHVAGKYTQRMVQAPEKAVSCLALAPAPAL